MDPARDKQKLECKWASETTGREGRCPALAWGNNLAALSMHVGNVQGRKRVDLASVRGLAKGEAIHGEPDHVRRK